MKYQLILFDVDSTLIEQEVIDLLAKRSNHENEVAQITARAMNGEIEFTSALFERLHLLKGMPESIFDDVLNEITFTPGFEILLAFLQEKDFHIGAVSGGFHNVLDKLLSPLKLDFLRANTLEIKDGLISGRLLSKPIDRNSKAQALEDFAKFHGIAIDKTVAVGDGANDIEMVQLAGLGVSYMGKEILNQNADLLITKPGLDALIPYLN